MITEQEMKEILGKGCPQGINKGQPGWEDVEKYHEACQLKEMLEQARCTGKSEGIAETEKRIAAEADFQRRLKVALAMPGGKEKTEMLSKLHREDRYEDLAAGVDKSHVADRILEKYRGSAEFEAAVEQAIKAEVKDSLEDDFDQWLKSITFDQAWRKLEETGSCDGFDGAEYKRVRQEYSELAHSEDAESFIRTRANIGPGVID